MISKSKISLAITLAGVSLSAMAYADTNYPTQMNSAYAYDVSYDCSAGKGILPSYLNNVLRPDVPEVVKYGNCAETWDKATPSTVVNFNNNIVASDNPNFGITGLNQLYAYGTDVEVYDKQGAEGTLDTPTYNSSTRDPIKSSDGSIYSGYNSLVNYIDTLGAQAANNKVKNLNIIVDGRHDNLGVFGGFLGQYDNDLGINSTSINNWTQDQATKAATQLLVNGYPDKTGTQLDGICTSLTKLQSYADKTYPAAGIKLGGIQFDLEPFHLPDNTTGALVCDGSSNAPADCGQYYFYKAVKNIFENNPSCSTLKPYFSTFIMAEALLNSKGEVSPEAADLFANSVDSYAAISLYDLGAAGQTDHITKYPVGNGPDNLYSDMANAGMNTVRAGFVASEPDYYNTAVAAEIAKMKTIDDAGIHYQFGIPLVASAHEFDGFKIQAPTNNDVYFATADSSTPGSFKPDMADSDDAMYDAKAAPADDTTQASYVKDVLEQIEQYYLTQAPKNYMGLTLWAFQPDNGNHWSPRNMVTTDMAGNAIPNEYYLWNPYPQSGDPSYAGYVNLDVYMRLYTPNGICTSSSGCPADEQNVWTDGVQNAIQNEQFNLFQFASAKPKINWSQDAVTAPASYNADGSFQVTVNENATLTPNPQGYQIAYVFALYDQNSGFISDCTAPSGGTGKVVVTCKVDSAHLGQPVQFATTAMVLNHPEISHYAIPLVKVAAPVQPVINWSDDAVQAPAQYNADGGFQVTVNENATLTPNPQGYQITYAFGLYDQNSQPIVGCTAPSGATGKVVVTCNVDNAHLGQPVQFATTAMVLNHPEISHYAIPLVKVAAPSS